MFRLAIASLAFPLLGCVAADGAGDEAMYIAKAVAAGGESCSFSSSPDSAFIGHGVITLASPAPYLIHPQVRSKITGAIGSDRTIQIRGARITLDFKDAAIGDLVADEHKKFQALFSAPLAPNEGSATDTTFPLIPEGAIAAIRTSMGNVENFETEVVGKIVVFGTLAGDEVTSQEFQFPVTLCTNCIIEAFGLPDFPSCPVADAGRQGNACNPFQDGTVDCCVNGGFLECPAPVQEN
jgi:hypothetical protein